MDSKNRNTNLYTLDVQKNTRRGKTVRIRTRRVYSNQQLCTQQLCSPYSPPLRANPAHSAASCVTLLPLYEKRANVKTPNARADPERLYQITCLKRKGQLHSAATPTCCPARGIDLDAYGLDLLRCECVFLWLVFTTSCNSLSF